MQYISRENICVPLSRIGLGTSRMGSLYSEEFSFELLDTFFSAGGTVLDTARNYYDWLPDGRGKSEKCIGKWMFNHNNRDKVCIISKGGTKGNGSKKVDLSRVNLCDELKESLDALQTDRLDIYVLHKDEIGRPVEDIVDTLQVLKEQGKISQVGVDNWSFERIVEANRYADKHGLEKIRIVETWWSLAEYTKEFWNDEDTRNMTEELLHYIEEKDMLGIAVTPQCKGFFQKVVNNGYESIDDFLKKRIATKRNLKKAEYIKKYCLENHISPTAFVIGYITSQKADSVAVIGCSKLDQLVDILDNGDMVLSQEIIQEIDKI